ncbi:MAG TPA: hypothetical protein VG984_01730 [Candidatus Paceibacterota bacterium]|nr:hypothetical protein [Candidatus Paceibacterota bacterium]
MRSFYPYLKIFIATALLAFLLFGSAGAMHFGMNMGADGKMAPCPFSGEGAICTMNPLEHIAAWQNAFTTTVQNERDIAFLLIALTLLFTVGFWRELFTKRDLRSLQKWHSVLREEFSIFDPLQEAFSNGILNPKVF